MLPKTGRRDSKQNVKRDCRALSALFLCEDLYHHVIQILLRAEILSLLTL